MKKITFLLIFTAFSLCMNAQVQNYNLGDIVDDFTVTDVEGEVHNLYDITSQGKYVYIDFFFDTCVPCQTTTPIFNEFFDKYGCNEGEVFCISINNGTDNNAEVIAFENAFGGPFEHAPAVSNEGGAGAVDANFGINAYPTYCLINPSNEIIELDIWPLSGIETFEATFPVGFNPPPMSCTILGIDNNTLDLSFQLFPNPNDGSSINLRLNNSTTKAELKIYNVLGKVVYSNSFESSSIQFNANLSSGTYIVTVTTETGSANKSLIVK